MLYCNIWYNKREKKASETHAEHPICAEEYFKKANILLRHYWWNNNILPPTLEYQTQFLFPWAEDHWASLGCPRVMFCTIIINHVSLSFVYELAHGELNLSSFLLG